jgi:hypothetical protein
MVAAQPQDAVLGRVPGLSGFRSIADYPKAMTLPGLQLGATAVQRLDELHRELAAQGITLGLARAKLSLGRAFDPSWVSQRLAATGLPEFPTLKAAVPAVERHRIGADVDQASQRPAPVGAKAEEHQE